MKVQAPAQGYGQGGQPPRILVTGARGFVGKVLCANLQQRGYRVRGAVRAAGAATERSGREPSETAVVGEITPETDWGAALASVDAIIHLAARVHVMRDVAADPLAEFRRVNTAGTERLARSAAAAGVRRLVYVSSIKVNGEETFGDRAFSASDDPAPQDAYAVSKWEAEQALQRVARETGLEIVIVRPPLVYGPGVKGNFAQLLEVAAKGIPLPLGSVRNQRDLIYVANLADALAVCAMHPAAAGQTYLVCDGQPVSTPDLLRKLAVAMGAPARVFSCPPAALRLAGRLTGKTRQMARLLGSLRVDDAKIRTDLHWAPPCTLQQGLQVTAEWRRTRPS